MGDSNTTSEIMPAAANRISQLVSQLPEIYQPIYRHPEISAVASRPCEDRLLYLTTVHNALLNKLRHQVRVLDLGCAQGFFSLNLAALGANVHGIDYLDKNITVCQSLAEEFPRLQATFKTTRIEEYVGRLLPGQFDLVLGLSVFHHLIHEKGLDFVHTLLDKISKVIPAAIFEVALKEEPLYWGQSQPEDPMQTLQHYTFVHELGQNKTHLSEIVRPLYFASNQFWYLSEHIGSFDTFKYDPHVFTQGTHEGTRRYYFGENQIVKVIRNNIPSREHINFQEYQNEIRFLSEPPEAFDAPKLILNGENDREMWLVRQLIEGRLLTEYFETGITFDHEQVITDILRQLVVLEQAGLYHNDVRCWNVLMTPGNRAILIDYGAISSERKDCAWPFDLLLSFIIFIREVVSHKTSSPFPIRRPWLDIGVLPKIYRNAFLRLLAMTKKDWSFANLQQFIAEAGNDQLKDDQNIANSFYELLKTMESASLMYEATFHHLRFSHSQAESRANQLQVDLDTVHVANQQTETKALQEESRANKLQANLDAVHTANHHHWQLAEAREQQIQNIYQSHSWRITAPLRWCGHQTRLVCQQGLAKRLKTLIKKIIRKLLGCVSAFFSSRPQFRLRCVTLIRRLGLYDHLRSYYFRCSGQQDPRNLPNLAALGGVSNAMLDQLTPRALQIYSDLKSAIEHRKKENC